MSEQNTDFLPFSFDAEPEQSHEFMPVSFYFEVGIGDRGGDDCAFQEVSGIDQKMDVQELREGGENRFVHKLPTGIKQQTLTLKRGIADDRSPLMRWCKFVLEGGLAVPIRPKSVQVSLLNDQGRAVRRWVFQNAYPISWSVDALDANKNSVVVESIEFAYLQLQREK